MNSAHDIIDSFRRAMADSGLEYHGDLIPDGKLHRFTPEGDRAGSDNGWYILFIDPPGGGKFGSWKLNIEQTYTHQTSEPVTDEQRQQWKQRSEAMRRQRDADEAKRHNLARQTAEALWHAAKPATATPYTERKRIQPIGARVGTWTDGEPDALLLPIVSGKTMHSMQAIFHDGTKRFLHGGAIRGNYIKIQPPNTPTNTIVICEGYATGVSIHMATGWAVVAAMSAGNMQPVAAKIRKMLPDSTIIVAADNDQWTDGNPGITEAKAAASSIGALLAIPSFDNLQDGSKPTDFNDMHCLYGIDAVKRCMDDVLNPPPEHHEHFPAPDDRDTPPAQYYEMMVDYFSPLQLTNSKGKPKAVIENLSEILVRLRATVRYNVISKEIDIILPDTTYSVDNNSNSCLARLKSECVKFDYSTANLTEYLLEIADRNRYNPVVQWVESKPWDGQDRMTPLTASLDSRNPDLSAILLRKWMIGAIHAAFSPYGIENSSVLVLQGEQYAGKTAWFWSLLRGMEHLGKEGAILAPNDKDSVLGAVKYWLVELGELDATFRKSDVAQLKGFITKAYDEIRKPYAVTFSKYPRRTAFFASVNPKHYLHDDTGNRRFWTVECGSGLNPRHGLDMQQVWSQVLSMYRAGQTWKLTRDELLMLNAHNDDYQTSDPIAELILKRFDLSPDIQRNERYTASDVLVMIGYDRPTPAQAKTCGAILRKHFGEPVKSNGRMTFAMPARLEQF